MTEHESFNAWADVRSLIADAHGLALLATRGCSGGLSDTNERRMADEGIAHANVIILQQALTLIDSLQPKGIVSTNEGTSPRGDARPLNAMSGGQVDGWGGTWKPGQRVPEGLPLGVLVEHLKKTQHQVFCQYCMVEAQIVAIENYSLDNEGDADFHTIHELSEIAKGLVEKLEALIDGAVGLTGQIGRLVLQAPA